MPRLVFVVFKGREDALQGVRRNEAYYNQKSVDLGLLIRAEARTYHCYPHLQGNVDDQVLRIGRDQEPQEARLLPLFSLFLGNPKVLPEEVRMLEAGRKIPNVFLVQSSFPSTVEQRLDVVECEPVPKRHTVFWRGV